MAALRNGGPKSYCRRSALSRLVQLTLPSTQPRCWAVYMERVLARVSSYVLAVCIGRPVCIGISVMCTGKMTYIGVRFGLTGSDWVISNTPLCATASVPTLTIMQYSRLFSMVLGLVLLVTLSCCLLSMTLCLLLTGISRLMSQCWTSRRLSMLYHTVHTRRYSGNFVTVASTGSRWHGLRAF